MMTLVSMLNLLLSWNLFLTDTILVSSSNLCKFFFTVVSISLTLVSFLVSHFHSTCCFSWMPLWFDFYYYYFLFLSSADMFVFTYGFVKIVNKIVSDCCIICFSCFKTPHLQSYSFAIAKKD